MTEPLKKDDFGIEDNNKLRLLRRGSYAVLFMAKGDQGSMQLIRILKNVQVPGMTTAYLDITQGKNRDVITMSRKTTAKITGVPYLGIFHDGKIKCRYKGAVDREKLRDYCQNKVIEFASSGSGPRPKQEGIINRKVKADQFSLSRNSKGSQPKTGPNPTSAGMVGLNAAWRVDT